MFTRKRSDSSPKKSHQEPGSGISKIPNIDEVDGIFLASPRGLIWGKTEPPDYSLMFSSANVPGIACKINLGDVLSSIFEKKYLRVPLSRNPETLIRKCIRKNPEWIPRRTSLAKLGENSPQRM